MARLLIGLDVPAAISRDLDPVALAQDAEQLGFDFVSSNDHVLGPEPRYEGWTLLTWLAGSTMRINVVSRVLGIPYRHPVMVAKMAETLDRLTAGRLWLGLGAGSGEGEFDAMGINPGSMGERVQRLGEAIEIMRGLWREDELTYQGRRYATSNAKMRPKPAHNIPIWLGTVGPRGLELTGRLADGWIPSLDYAPPERAGAMIAAIRGAAVDAGRDPGALDLIYNLELSFDGPPSNGILSGKPDAIVERLLGFRELGFTGFNFLLRDANRRDAAERLANQVIPELRDRRS